MILTGVKPMEVSKMVEEALRIIEEAKERDLTLRLIGAIAFRVHCPKYLHMFTGLERELSDLDFLGDGRHKRKIIKLLEELGYTMDKEMLIHGRYIFHSQSHERHVDVFFDRLRMCHIIDFRRRFENDYPTIPLAELLLEKMQIVEINEKDIKDTILLLREHDLGDHDRETINQNYIAKILSDDWGFYHTVNTNLNKVKALSSHYKALSDEDRRNINKKVENLLNVIENEPKTFRWKLRAKIGTRKIWYERVEEIER